MRRHKHNRREDERQKRKRRGGKGMEEQLKMEGEKAKEEKGGRCG